MEVLDFLKVTLLLLNDVNSYIQKEIERRKMSNINILSRKIQLIPVGDKEEVNRVYTYLRNGMKAQNAAMNQYMSALYVSMQNDIINNDRKELRHLYGRISSSKKGSAYESTIEFAKGLPISAWRKRVEDNFNNAMKKGLRYGKLSLPTYKDDNPLIISSDYVMLRSLSRCNDGIYHNYETHSEFLKHLYDKDLELFLKFANGITFKIILGNPHKSAALRSEFKNIFEEYYEVNTSTIEFSGTKIILNLSITVPQKQIELDENTVVGVDVGIAIPAVCALNTNDVYKKFIGSKDEFISMRTKIQSQRKRLQKSLNKTSGGHGRKKKLRSLNRFKDCESNWVKHYNHEVSKQIIDFAVKNKAKYINIEDLSNIGKNIKNRFILRNWSYYQLQEFIIYKANKYGITVRKINPYHTSQTCSCCGHWEEGQRVSQSEFICKNPDCKNFGKSINADFNAARNIAMSTDFVD